MSNLPLTTPDLVCMLDLDPNGAETTSDLQSLEQDIFHVLINLLGDNPDDPGRGVGIDQYLSGTLDQIAPLAKIIENQIDQDDRVDSCSCGIIQNDSSSPYPITISIEVGVNGAVIGLQFGWTGSGVVPLSPVEGGP